MATRFCIVVDPIYAFERLLEIGLPDDARKTEDRVSKHLGTRHAARNSIMSTPPRQEI